jgi:hypothetical protein
MGRDNYRRYPYRHHIGTPYRAQVGWRCRVFDFFCKIVFVGAGKTRRASYQAAMVGRDTLTRAARKERECAKKALRGIAWTDKPHKTRSMSFSA